MRRFPAQLHGGRTEASLDWPRALAPRGLGRVVREAVLFADGQQEGHVRPAGWDTVEEAIGQVRRTARSSS